MTRLLVLAALTAVLAGPVAAQSANSVAVQHFNQDIDNSNDRALLVSPTGANVVFSNRTAPGQLDAIRHFNSDSDRSSDRIDARRLTFAANTPVAGADIFARIAAEQEGSS